MVFVVVPTKVKTDSLEWAHPLVRDWFIQKFGSPTEPQQQGWPSILAGQSTLISAPTGSGKTFAAFLACIEHLVRQALAGQLTNRTEVVYVSPLKALSNDIHKNLTGPLNEIAALAIERGLTMQEIRVAVRTGDTLMRERQAMLKKPPHILVTTPESLYILLTAEKSRELLTGVKTLIVDEIHAIADDKRGAHLALSLERLAALSPDLIRIGLSATVKPIEQVAHFLVGSQRPKPVLVNIGHTRELDLAIEVPPMELGPIAANEMWDKIYDRVAELARENRSTLVFVNTRRLAERVAHHLAERLGEEQVAAHHGSLSRKLRLAAETKLKNGELKALVATASLELGIDIGSVDLVCQLGSPRAIGVALQRIGRAGHWRGAVPKGRIFATTRDELLECAALVNAIRTGDLDKLIMPQEPIDILAQQLVATCATGDWREDDLFALVRSAYPYINLTRAIFDATLEMLADGIAGARGRYGAYLFRDRVNGMVRARRGSRLTAITSGGAIPDNGLFTVLAEPEGTMVGTLDEDFAVESNRGDIILLGTTSWQIKRIESAAGRVIVDDAKGAPPSVPFWRGEAPARTLELSAHVSELRRTLSEMMATSSATGEVQAQPEVIKAVAWLQEHCGLDQSGAQQLVHYLLQGRAVLGAVPTQKCVIAERFFDESGGMQLIIHAPFGARINKAWGLALRKRFCRSFNFELQAAATDDGLNIALAEQHSFPLADVFQFLHPNSLKEVLTQAVLQSPLFTTRWRWDATRSLALVRFRNGKKVPPNIQRMRADDLLAAVFPDAAACQDNLGGRDIELPDHPLINETMKDALTEALDVDGLISILHDMASGAIQCLAVDTPVPSPFSHEILNANPYAFLDDAPLEERRARAVEMRRVLPESVLQEVGRLDPAAIQEVQQQAWPDIRNADELHDALQTLIAFRDSASEDARVLSVNRVPDQKRVLSADVDHADRAAQGCAARSQEQFRLHDPHPRSELVHETGIKSLDSDFPSAHWQTHFDQLVATGRAGVATYQGQTFWLAVEKKKTFSSIYPTAVLQNPLQDIEERQPPREEAMVTLICGWLQHLGPTTSQELSDRLALPVNEVDQALLKLELSGLILRGQFRSSIPPFEKGGHGGISQANPEWCERRLLARIHRLTLSKLRKEIEPVTAAQFLQWLLSWQHLQPGTQLRGEHGLLEVIKQLQGFEIPAKAWERQILAKRVSDYDPSVLDRLCLTGAVGWGRLSAHPATLANVVSMPDPDSKEKRVIPTSVAPITFFIRDDVDWMSVPNRFANGEDLPGLSAQARSIYSYLQQRGASFFADIVRGAGKLNAEVETGLWELVAAGLVTADGFDNLRALIDPLRRAGKGRRRLGKPRYSGGRWSLLQVTPANNQGLQIEAVCWLLLKRYGVVFRDLLARETMLPRWRELLLAFRRLEDRGEIRGGRFVTGFVGEQFALPYAVESLRAMRKQQPSAEIVSIAAVDPLNLAGILLPGGRVTAIAGKTLQLRDGVRV